jgi:uncharacterized lipoprotein YehR (DUF1307 family)
MPRNLLLISVVCCAALLGCGKKEEAKKVDIDNNSSGNPLTAPVDYLGAVNKGRKTAIKQIDLAYVQNAINLFNAQEDRFPKSLDELVQKRYVGQVPALPPGQRLDYNPTTGQLKVVSQ